MAKKPTKKHVRKDPLATPESIVITMVVDESGSMAHLKDATMAGFNEYVDTLQRDLKGVRSYFSAITFDTRGVRKLQVGAGLHDAVRLSHANYTPTGGTPLFDAIGQAIQSTAEVMVQQSGTKAIVVIQTDGAENASTEYTLANIKTEIELMTAKGWQFVFIGAGIDAFAAGTAMGVAAGATMSYGANDHNTRAVFTATACNSQLYASGAATSMNYMSSQRDSSGESRAIQEKVRKAQAKRAVAR